MSDLRGIVFLVEDDPECNDSVATLLTERSYFVIESYSCEEALARMGGIPRPSVAIIDLAMDGMKGAELIRRMRSADRLAWIPIVAITGTAQDAPGGCDRFIRKPFTGREILDAVEALIRTT